MSIFILWKHLQFQNQFVVSLLKMWLPSKSNYIVKELMKQYNCMIK